MIARQVIFEGRVQGVGFRYTVKDLARGFDVCGFVKNLDDGSVELQVMGEADELDAFLCEIIDESAMARNIRQHRMAEIPLLKDCRGFRIER
jgi:acylphosphatase